MPKVRTFQTNFSAGFLDRLMFGRLDTKLYNNGAAKLDNWLILVQGGIRRRPGTTYLATLPADSRLESFVFSRAEDYILAFNGTQISIYDDQGTLVTTVTGAPWTAGDIDELRITQRGDTMIIAHEDIPLQILKRTSISTFTLNNFTFETLSNNKVFQPYYKFADSNVTLTPSGTTGSVTVTASASVFTSSYVGENIRIEKKQLRVTGFTSGTQVTATVIDTLNNTNAQDIWDEPVYNSIRGNPKVCVFHGNRLWIGGGGELPSHVFSSNASAFFKFDDGTALDGESVQAPIGHEKVNVLQHLASGKNLFVLSDLAELVIPESTGSPITPGGFSVERMSGYGASNVRPNEFDQGLIYVQDTGKAVREFIKSEFEEDYTIPAISLIAGSLITTIEDLASIHGIEDGPEQFTVFVNDDGTLPIYHSLKTESIRAWSKWITRDGDNFKSVVTLGENVFACVEREINSSTVYYLERFDVDSMLDCSDYQTGAESSTWSGYTHLANETVDVVIGDGTGNRSKYHLGQFTIDGSGNLDISPDTAQEIEVGLLFEPEAELLPVMVQAPDGFILSKPKRMVSASILFESTLAATIDGTRMIIRKVNDDLSLPPDPVSVQKKFHLLGVNRNQQLTIECPVPLPCTITAVEQEFVF